LSTIRQVVTDSLDRAGYRQYLSYAEPVIGALDARETQIKEGLRSFAADQGLRQEQIDRVFIQVGLDEQPQVMAQTGSVQRTDAPGMSNQDAPRPEGEPSLADVMQAVQQIGQRMENLAQQAQRYGINV